MSLIPRALRPMTILRRRAMRRGLRGDSAMWQFVALMLMGGSSAMKLTARREGFFGGSRFWKTVFYAVIVNDLVKKIAVKETEVLSTEKLTAGQSVTITALDPKS